MVFNSKLTIALIYLETQEIMQKNLKRNQKLKKKKLKLMNKKKNQDYLALC